AECGLRRAARRAARGDIITGGAPPAVLLREDRAQEPQLAELSEEVAGKMLRLVPLQDVRPDLRFDEVAKGLKDGLALGGDGGAHGTILDRGRGPRFAFNASTAVPPALPSTARCRSPCSSASGSIHTRRPRGPSRK